MKKMITFVIKQIEKMKRIITTITAALGVALAAHCGPEIKWLDTEHDFGAFSEDDGPVSSEMRYVNVGDD